MKNRSFHVSCPINVLFVLLIAQLSLTSSTARTMDDKLEKYSSWQKDVSPLFALSEIRNRSPKRYTAEDQHRTNGMNTLVTDVDNVESLEDGNSYKKKTNRVGKMMDRWIRRKKHLIGLSSLSRGFKCPRVQRHSKGPSNFPSTMRNWFSGMPFWTSSFFIFTILLATTLTLSKCETMDDPNILASSRSEMRADKELDFRYIIDVPLRRCPKHQKRDHLGKCRDIFGVPTNGCELAATKIVDLLAIIFTLRIFSSLLRL